MTEILAILAAAVGVALFGYVMRGRPRVCGSGCSCGAPRQDGVCGANPDRTEPEHAKR